MAGLAAGASAVHVTVNGIGERAGSAQLEQVALSLEALYGQDTGLDLSKLKDLSDTVARLAREPINPTAPVVGDEIFGWETGMPSSLWENARKSDPLVMLPYRWDLVGNREPILDLGKKSGKDNLRVWLERYDLTVDEDKKMDLLMAVKAKGIELHRTLNEAEFRELVAKFQ